MPGELVTGDIELIIVQGRRIRVSFALQLKAPQLMSLVS